MYSLLLVPYCLQDNWFKLHGLIPFLHSSSAAVMSRDPQPSDMVGKPIPPSFHVKDKKGGNIRKSCDEIEMPHDM